MVDYNNLKVTELKEELKKRSIPTTNLTRKQQIIDRLLEDDKESDESNNDVVVVEATTEGPSAAADNVTLERAADAPIVSQHSPLAPQEDMDVAEPEPVKSADPEDATGVAKQEENSTKDHAPVQPAATAEEQPVVTADHTEDTAMTTPDRSPLRDGADAAADGTLDSRKRKRRSVTPSVSQESVSKKLKQAEEGESEVVTLEKGGAPASESVDGNTAIKEDARDQIDMPDAPTDDKDTMVQPLSTSNDVARAVTPDAADPEIKESTNGHPRRDSEAVPGRSTRSPNQRRFKDIINPSATSAHEAMDTQIPIDDGVEVSPALHPATRALYVRELIRPININALREHIEQLATPPGQSSSGNLVEECHVDTLKTHALVLFTSVTAASRARAGLHARTWPPEAQRKPLWVDFIPEERMPEWIEQERAGGGQRASTAKRWEILYDVLDDRVDVSLVEASAASQPRTGFAQGMPGAPIGPRSSLPNQQQQQRSSFSQSERRRPSQPLAAPARPTAKAVEEASASFLELDKLFKFTAAKPKLYWQPVGGELADHRLDEIDRETSRDWDPREDAKLHGNALGRGLDQLKRYTFEDGDVLVDGGPEYGGGAAFGRGGESYRGGGGGGGGGGRRRGADRYR